MNEARDSDAAGASRPAGQSASGVVPGRASSTPASIGSGQPANAATSDLPGEPNGEPALGELMMPSRAIPDLENGDRRANFSNTRDAQGTDAGRGQSSTRYDCPGGPDASRSSGVHADSKDDAAGVGRPSAGLGTAGVPRSSRPGMKYPGGNEPGVETSPRAFRGPRAAVAGPYGCPEFTSEELATFLN